MYLMADEPEKLVVNHLETNLAQLNAGSESIGDFDIGSKVHEFGMTYFESDTGMTVLIVVLVIVILICIVICCICCCTFCAVGKAI